MRVCACVRVCVCECVLLNKRTKSMTPVRFSSVFWGGRRRIRSNAQSSCRSVCKMIPKKKERKQGKEWSTLRKSNSCTYRKKEGLLTMAGVCFFAALLLCFFVALLLCLSACLLVCLSACLLVCFFACGLLMAFGVCVFGFFFVSASSSFFFLVCSLVQDGSEFWLVSPTLCLLQPLSALTAVRLTSVDRPKLPQKGKTLMATKTLRSALSAAPQTALLPLCRRHQHRVRLLFPSLIDSPLPSN